MEAHRRLHLLLLLGAGLAAEIAAPPEPGVVERLQEVTALQNGGDDAAPQVLARHLTNINSHRSYFMFEVFIFWTI